MDIPYFVYPFISWWNNWVISTFWLLWISMYKFWPGHMFSVILGIYLGVELLDHMVTLCLTFRGTAKLFSKVVVPFYTPDNVWGFQFLKHAHQHLLFPFLSIVVLLDVKWYHIVVLICIFLVTNNVDHHIASSWLFIYLLWKKS